MCLHLRPDRDVGISTVFRYFRSNTPIQEYEVIKPLHKTSCMHDAREFHLYLIICSSIYYVDHFRLGNIYFMILWLYNLVVFLLCYRIYTNIFLMEIIFPQSFSHWKTCESWSWVINEVISSVRKTNKKNVIINSIYNVIIIISIFSINFDRCLSLLIFLWKSLKQWKSAKSVDFHQCYYQARWSVNVDEICYWFIVSTLPLITCRLFLGLCFKTSPCLFCSVFLTSNIEVFFLNSFKIWFIIFDTSHFFSNKY